MPTAGLSLVGFMDGPVAINYLRNACVPKDPSDGALEKEWATAQQRLGDPIKGAGMPDIQPFPKEGIPHIRRIIEMPWAQSAYGSPLTEENFRLVEIDKLLAFQFTIDGARSQHHCGSLKEKPSVEDLIALCLPLDVPQENFQVARGPQSAMIKARSLNLRTFAAGVNQTFMGIEFGVAPPFIQIVRYNGRSYLHNGFHRALGIRKAGPTHLPCIFREVSTPEEIGLHPHGTFQVSLLESNNPPTLAHFTQGRAYDVQVRAVSRVLHVSWAEYVVTDE